MAEKKGGKPTELTVTRTGQLIIPERNQGSLFPEALEKARQDPKLNVAINPRTGTVIIERKK